MPEKNLCLNKIPRQLTLLAGVILGMLAFLSIGNFIFSALALCIFGFFYCHIPGEDRPFIIKLAFIGFILRIVLIFLYYYFYLHIGRTDVLAPDGETYSQHGWYISRLLVGDSPYQVPNRSEMIFTDAGHYSDLVGYFKGELPPIGSYQIGIFTYLIGILFAAFNYSPLIIKLINSAFSVLTGILLYFIGSDIFNPRIGKWAMASLLFLPSFVVYSITALRDSTIIFMITLVIWMMTRYQKRKKLILPILASIVTMAIETLRIDMMYPFFALIVLIVLFNLRTGIFKKCLILVFVCVMLFSFPPTRKRIKSFFDINDFFSVHLGYVNTRGNNYMIFPERCYGGNKFIGLGPLEIAGGFAKGTLHLLLEPLPNRISATSLLPATLQSFLISLLIPFIILGVGIGLRYRFYQVMPVVAYLAIFIPLMAVTEGNIGTVFRHRDMLMPFLIIFGIVGLYAKICRKNPL